MSLFFISKITQKVRTTRAKFQIKKEEFTAFKNLKQNDNLSKPIFTQKFGTNKKQQETGLANIKSNPFYWFDWIKTKTLSFFKSKTEKPINPYEDCEPKSENYQIETRKEPSILVKLVKTPVLAILNLGNFLIKKLTFGYIDIKGSSKSLEAIKIKIYSLTKYTKKFSNYLVVYFKNGQNYLIKFRDSKQYEEFEKNKGKLTKTILEKSSKWKFFKLNFGMFETLKAMGTGKFNVINRYINANYMSKKFYDWKYKSQENAENIKKDPKGFFKKVLYFFNLRAIFSSKTDSMKKKAKLLIFKLFLLYIAFYGVKTAFHKIMYNDNDKLTKEALLMFKQMREQNEELMNQNRVLFEENMKFKNKKL